MKAGTRHDPKCPHCKGWGFEPDHPTDVPCTVCGGTGRPKPQPQTGELLDG